MTHQLSQREARRIAVCAQLLDRSRPTELLEVVRHLGAVQVDLTAAVAPSADLVCWSRLGAAYRPEDLDALLEDRSLVELGGFLRPAEDIALFRSDFANWGKGEPSLDWQVGNAQWVRANDACRQEILQTLRSEGPLPAQELPDTCAVPWRSSGWTNNRNVARMLGFMEMRGEVAVSSRDGGARTWDLAERIYPDGEAVPAAEASGIREARRLASLGIARATGPKCPAEPTDVAQAGEPAVIEGVRGTWRVDPEQLGQPFSGRCALLSPLDRLVFDRKRMVDIFGFDYQLEMYKPAAKRRWGYYALPILYGDRLAGKVDATSDLEAGLLRVTAIHEDVEFSRTMREAVDRELRSLARCLELEVTRET